MRALVAGVAVLVAVALASGAGARTRAVSSEAGFQAAVQDFRWTGGVIVLRAGQYPQLTIGPRPGRWLTVRARPGAVVRELDVHGTRRVRLVRVTISNVRGRRAFLDVHRSRHVAVQGARVRGRNGGGSRMSVTNSRYVVVRSSQFRLTRGVSFRTLDSRHVTLEGNRFRDCLGCDFVYVKRISHLTIRGNTFDRAVPGVCGEHLKCNHQDIFQGSGGLHWLIEENRFGVAYWGAAQIYISGFFFTDDVVIRGNTFLRDDPLVPGMASWSGMVIGQPYGWVGIPRNVRIEGNTVLSGGPRTLGNYVGVANSIILTRQYADVPLEERPVVTGNVVATTTHPDLLCGMAREATNNLTESGEPVC